MKFCENCKHCEHKRIPAVYFSDGFSGTKIEEQNFYTCLRSEGSVITAGERLNCESERSGGFVYDQEEHCGPEGQFYEEKEAPGKDLRQLFGLD